MGRIVILQELTLRELTEEIARLVENLDDDQFLIFHFVDFDRDKKEWSAIIEAGG